MSSVIIPSPRDLRRELAAREADKSCVANGMPMVRAALREADREPPGHQDANDAVDARHVRTVHQENP